MCMEKKKKKKKERKKEINAHTVIRTQDLVITSDALYQLSHASFAVAKGR